MIGRREQDRLLGRAQRVERHRLAVETGQAERWGGSAEGEPLLFFFLFFLVLVIVCDLDVRVFERGLDAVEPDEEPPVLTEEMDEQPGDPGQRGEQDDARSPA